MQAQEEQNRRIEEWEEVEQVCLTEWERRDLIRANPETLSLTAIRRELPLWIK